MPESFELPPSAFKVLEVVGSEMEEAEDLAAPERAAKPIRAVQASSLTPLQVRQALATNLVLKFGTHSGN